MEKPVVRNVLFSLMGSQPGPVYNATQLLSWTDLCIFYSDKFQDLAEEVKAKMSQMYESAQIEIVEIEPFDLQGAISAIVNKAVEMMRKNKKAGREVKISINITGGTDVMTSAALLAGMMLDARLYYIKAKRNEETGEYYDPEVIDINPPRVMTEEIDAKKFRVMEVIYNARDKEKMISTAEIADEANFNSSSAVKRHLDTLEKKEVIRSEKEGKYRYYALTENGELFYLLKSVQRE